MNMCHMQDFSDIGFHSGSAAAHRSLKEAFVAYHDIRLKRAIEIWVLHLGSDCEGLYSPLCTCGRPACTHHLSKPLEYQ